MNIRHLIIFVTSVILYAVAVGMMFRITWALHPGSMAMQAFVGVGMLLTTAVSWPLFVELFRNIFKNEWWKK